MRGRGLLGGDGLVSGSNLPSALMMDEGGGGVRARDSHAVRSLASAFFMLDEREMK